MGRIQLRPPSAISSHDAYGLGGPFNETAVQDGRIVSGQRAEDVLPPSAEHVRSLMRSQGRHLRIAMQTSKELERAWKRVQVDMLGTHDGGYGTMFFYKIYYSFILNIFFTS